MEPTGERSDEEAVMWANAAIARPQWSRPASGRMSAPAGWYLRARHEPQWSRPASGRMSTAVPAVIELAAAAAMEPTGERSDEVSRSFSAARR